MSIGGQQQIGPDGPHNFARDGRQYMITPIQHPTDGAAFERQSLSRIPLTPPLILQLDTWDENHRLIIPSDALSSMVCSVTLEGLDGQERAMVRVPDTDIIIKTTAGSTVSPAFEMESQTGHPGVYFVFPDIGVAYPGRFRLNCALMPLNGGEALTTCLTDPFTVYPRSQFFVPPTTAMTRHFAEQRIVPLLQIGSLREFWPEG
ncbi:hypothetical protein CspeluHIS016_0300830 [Cutaneotrichosporon spelunceum]|uniref:Velvet domain-containing protein n=1 Tax=Cutaneotrichosporon spelunceum TaxID=1672016 RepID=A0AAD3YBL8_9TREE|nr:hypothetical protein CspeluHIS016_0300830 [Cutaneotrichosporon spelunceum]